MYNPKDGSKKKIVHSGNEGKRNYKVYDKYGNYKKVVSLEERKRIALEARQKRIGTWERKRNQRIEFSKENVDFLGKKEVISFKNSTNTLIQIPIKKIDESSNIYVTRNTKNVRKLVKILDEKVNVKEQFGKVDNIYIVKHNQLGGIASYDHVSNSLFVSEELATKKGFKKLVDNSYFAANDINDLLVHELGGHKAHWDAVKRYQEVNKISDIRDAKNELEKNLQLYISKQYSENVFVLSISKNAFTNYYDRDNILNGNRLNELIADAKILMDKGILYDEEFEKLLKEVLEYDD